jgi:uncharacterized protein (DUF427 family)
MAAGITITPTVEPLIIRAGGMVLGRTDRALTLHEAGHGAVCYVPRLDVDMNCLEPSLRRSTCPWKGEASYFSVITPQGVLRDAVWSYETPKPSVAALAGHLAFYTDRITLERA